METDHSTLRAGLGAGSPSANRLTGRFKLIYNPRSGRNARDPSILERAKAFVGQGECDADLVFTEAPHHATALAREAVAQGCACVVAIGGDGTLNEVAAALVGTEVALGLIPCGSGNGLGRHLGIPGPGRGAFRTLLNGRTRCIDTGDVNGIPFFNAMGLGFDAEISQRFNRLAKRGFGAYVRTTLGLLRSYPPQHYKITDAHGSRVVQAFLLAVANSDQYGNDCFIAPGARVDDGELDLCALPPVGLLNAVPLATRLFTKAIHRGRGVTSARAHSFTIERNEAGAVHTDGEVHELPATLKITCRPRSLCIRVPVA
ncbi:diacylglycerol/lipid kinase family protein [Nibricoccus sp. IMCC34717]|uniref:diacylglycerol/lipid kinase family protein n=1 Tax=Nibricoccus sp. IMCC34717 TaxID=3034021 RepID=UPI00384AA4C7